MAINPMAGRGPELLVPAGNMEKLETAVVYGADAVYLGGGTLNLRAQASGFDFPDLAKAIRLARVHGVRVYYLLNAMPRQPQMKELGEHFEALAALSDQGQGPDAVIIADPGVFRATRRNLPDMPIHISTQANTVNLESALFWRDLGADRVNLARELRGEEIREILIAFKQLSPPIEVEVFVHGAQCMAISGRCYLSSYLNGRPANLGQCTHPCRYDYKVRSLGVEEQTREGETLWDVREYWEKFGDTDGKDGAARGEEGYSALFAAHDLCLLHYLEWMKQAGVAAVKIEGRTKSSSYLAQVTDAYASALHAVRRPGKTFSPEKYLGDLINAATRPLSTGFFEAGKQRVIADPVAPENARPVLARIVEGVRPGVWVIDVKHRWHTKDDPVEILLPGMRRPALSSEEFGVENEEGQGLLEVHSGQSALLFCDRPELSPGLFLRRSWVMD